LKPSIKIEIKPVVWKKDSFGNFLLDPSGRKIVERIGTQVQSTEKYSFVAVITKTESLEVNDIVHVELEDVKNTDIVVGIPGSGISAGATGTTSSPPIVQPPQPPPPPPPPPPPSVIVDDNNWTVVKAASDSRLIYIANSSQGGNDTAARAVKNNRGYYLPSDPEIGPDPMNPIGPIVAYETPFEASKMFRGRKYSGDRADGYPSNSVVFVSCPDWIMFRRSGEWTFDKEHPTAWGPQFRNIGGMIGNWVQGKNMFSYDQGGPRGRLNEPYVIGAWGPPSEPRPILRRTGSTIGGSISIGSGAHGRILSLHLEGEKGNKGVVGSASIGWSTAGDVPDHVAENLVIEDCYINGSLGAVNIGQPNAVFRRCVITGAWNNQGHVQGVFISNPDRDFVFEECVFDRNGYKENPNEPTTWTGKVTSSLSIGELPFGTGVQPTRTWFDRNLYVSTYNSMTLRGCIISRGGGGSSVQMREGGICERNLFMWCQQSLGIPHPESTTSRVKSSIVKQNVVLHDDHLLPPGGWGTGLGVGGGADDTVIIDDNIVAHFHRGTNGGESLMISGKSSSGTDPARAPSPLQKGFVMNNDILHQFGTGGILVERSVPQSFTYTIDQAKVVNNKVSASRLLSGQGDGSRPQTFKYSGNKYHSSGSPSTHFIKQWTGADYRSFATNADLSGWKASGFDLDVESVESDFSKFKNLVGWTNPERDIVSYMQSIDSTYVPDEEIHVDDDCSGEKQAVRRKVREVMSTGITGSYTGLSESHSRLIARRYHAFITFINRAKANRKGAWDSRYTAEAVNNYIREGFGKQAVGGPYTTKMSDAQNY